MYNEHILLSKHDWEQFSAIKRWISEWHDFILLESQYTTRSVYDASVYNKSTSNVECLSGDNNGMECVSKFLTWTPLKTCGVS